MISEKKFFTTANTCIFFPVLGAIPCDSGRSIWTEDGFLAPEGLPPTTSVFRVVVGRSWLMGVCCTGHWLVGGFTKLRFRGTGDSVEVEGHGEGGWGNTAAQARSLIGAV